LISVVVVNYNSGAFLKDCVQSVLSQTDEVLIVDNASTDGSLDQLTACFKNEPGLKIIRNKANRGFAAACNIGIQQAKGNRILFLNPDCRLEADVASEMLRVLETGDAVGMVGGLLINPDGSEQGGGRRAVPTPWRSFVHAFGLSRFSNRWPKLLSDYYLHNSPLPSCPEVVEAISGACMLVKREAIDDIGLWDESYFLHCEDLDWCMRFRQKGWRVMFVPAARVFHALGVCSRSRPIFVEWHKHKGMIRFYGKFFHHQYPGLLFWIVRAGVWSRFSAIAVYHIVRHLKQWLKHDRV
jgi:GT2 family glycosyltransferase